MKTPRRSAHLRSCNLSKGIIKWQIILPEVLFGKWSEPDLLNACSVIIMYPWNYWLLRFLAFVVDVLCAALLAVILLLTWNIRCFKASVFDVIRVEAESLEISGFQRTTRSPNSSGGMEIATLNRGTAKGIFKGHSGLYDIVLSYFDIDSQGYSSIILKIGDQKVEHSMTADGNELLNETVAKNIYIEQNSQIEIIGISTDQELTYIDYIDFIPSDSPAFRPNGTERSYYFQNFYKAIDYDDMNVHLSLIKIPVFMGLLSLLFLSFVNWTPGMYFTGLRVIGINAPSFRVALLRLLGNFLSICYLGLGSLSMFFAKYRQSWGDILSVTFIVTRSMERPGTLAHTTSSSVFGTGIQDIGGFDRVPLECGLASLCIDGAIVLVFGLASFLIQPLSPLEKNKNQRIRMEAEDMNYTANMTDQSLYASSWKYVFTRSSSNFESTFNGPDGNYDINIKFSPAGNQFGNMLDVKAGGQRYFFKGLIKKKFYRLRRILNNVPLVKGDIIQIRSASYEEIDYLDFLPHVTSIAERDDVVFFQHPRDIGEFIEWSKILLFCAISIAASLLFHVLALGVAGFSPGTVLAGYGIRKTGTRGTTPGVADVLRFYLNLILLKPAISLLQINSFRINELSENATKKVELVFFGVSSN